VLRKVDAWQDKRVKAGVPERERRAGLVLDFDDAVGEAVEKLKAKGFKSPYLKTFVVARVNPIRFIKGDLPPLDELFPSMTKRARGMNIDKISQADVARTGGPPPEEG
jgi:ParB family transcriptional regulator, chromosome partitioning protein